jgi:hypothetical protein
MSMSTTSPLSGALRQVFMQPTRGIVGLVDDLLAVCLAQGLQLDWQTDHCRARSGEGEWEELEDVPLRKSVFRAVLARVAVLCNERSPKSVSPYGGQGELSIGASPGTVLRVAFVNTPAAQRLELRTVTAPCPTMERSGQ